MNILKLFLYYVIFLFSSLYALSFLGGSKEQITSIFGIAIAIFSILATKEILNSTESKQERMSLSIFYYILFSLVSSILFLYIDNLMHFTKGDGTVLLGAILYVFIGLLFSPIILYHK